MLSHGTVPVQVMALFTKFNKNGGETIDKKEAQESFGQMGYDFVADCDCDKDGEVSQEEFVDFFKLIKGNSNSYAPFNECLLGFATFG